MDNTFEGVGAALRDALPEGVELMYAPKGTNMYSIMDHGGGDPEFVMDGPKKGFFKLSREHFGELVIDRDDSDGRKISSLKVYLSNTSRADELKAIFEKFKKKFGLIKSIYIRR